MSIRPNEQQQICYVIVLYKPDERVTAQLKILCSQLSPLIIILNGPTKYQNEILNLHDDDKTLVIINQSNHGLSFAYNQAYEYAQTIACDYLCTFDQDTVPSESFNMSMAEIITKKTDDIVIVGANYFDPNQGKKLIKPNPDKAFRKAKTVISSGMCVSLRFLKDISGFDERFFIDQIDHDICLKALNRHQQVVISNEVLMTHSVGEADGVTIPLFGNFPSHNALRKYYITRNSLLLIRQNIFKQPMWAFKRLIKLTLGVVFILLFDRDKKKKLLAIRYGISDFTQNKYGQCQHLL